MPFTRGSDLIAKALEKEQDDRTWEMYLAILPNMTEKTYKTFEQFKESLTQKRTTTTTPSKTTEELIQEAERIKKADQQQRGMKKGQG